MRGSDKRVQFNIDLSKYIDLKTLIGEDMPISTYVHGLVLQHLNENAERIKQILIAKGRYYEQFKVIPNKPDDHGA